MSRFADSIWSYRPFFVAASLYAALSVPLSLQGMLSATPWVAALASPHAHARELLFGFAYCVVAGYLLGKMHRWQVWGILLLWFAARAAWWLAPYGAATSLAQAAFVIAFAVPVIDKFSGGRKLRNLATVPLVALLALGSLAYDASLSLPGVTAYGVALGVVLLLGWLMAFMGGRLLAPAIAGHLDKQGEELHARVQPRIEGAIIVALAFAALFAPIPALQVAAGAGAAAGGALIAVRLLRWRLWRCRGRVDLWCLGAGYAWLAAGLLLTGTSLLMSSSPRGALHLVTVGALGTLTLNVMLRTHLQRQGHRTYTDGLLPFATALIGLAAVARVWAASAAGGAASALALAAGAWCIAYLLLARRLLGR